MQLLTLALSDRDGLNEVIVSQKPRKPKFSSHEGEGFN